MEEELRQAVVQQVVLADELSFARCAGLDRDLARGGIVKRSLWQAFDKITRSASETERAGLFRDNARKFYRIPG